MKEIAVLGSTGSIGTQTMDVIRLHSDLFHASVIAAHKSIDKLREQAAEFHPHAIVITDEEAGKKFLEIYDGDADVLIGEAALSEVVKQSSALQDFFRRWKRFAQGRSWLLQTRRRWSQAVRLFLRKRKSIIR